jgi:hypothetical protein
MSKSTSKCPIRIDKRKMGNNRTAHCPLPTAAASCLLFMVCPAGIRTPNQQIMRRFEGHQQGETKRDEAVFTESAAVKVRYI